MGDGRVIRSIGELRELLKTMKEDVFNYHVSEDHNDFADWIDAVFDDAKLASAVAVAKTQKDLLNVLYDF